MLSRDIVVPGNQPRARGGNWSFLKRKNFMINSKLKKYILRKSANDHEQLLFINIIIINKYYAVKKAVRRNLNGQRDVLCGECYSG